MWLCTKLGFYSIVKKKPNEYHVRARSRADLENLVMNMGKALKAPFSEIHHWPTADYPWRIIVDLKRHHGIVMMLSDEVDYSNFKGMISANKDQSSKHHAYAEVWGIMREWQAEDSGL